MFKLLLPALAVLLAAAAGCGEPTIPREQAYDPAKLAGTVDTALPTAARARQEALRKVLVSLQRGVAFNALAGYHPDVRLSESERDFLEGAINLARWDFNGPPSGNDVPVVLYFSRDGSGGNEKQVQRVYTVTGGSGRFTISRK